jgi:poly(beta-D-mannuronate) lyase
MPRLRRFAPLLLLLLVTLNCAFPDAALAAERVVEPTDDLEEAFDGLQPGDVVILEDGTWKDAKIQVKATGTEQQPVVVRARTPGGVVITGESHLRVSGRWVEVRNLLFRDVVDQSEIVALRTGGRDLAEHCRITNCAIVNTLPPEGQIESKWLSMYGSDNRVDHCYVGGKNSRGTTFVVWIGEGPNRHRVDHNHFGPRPELGKNGGETIRVGDSETSLQESRTLVERNLFTDCDGEAEIVSNKSCDNVFRENTFERCSGALTLRHGNRALVERNLFLGGGKKGSGGVRIIGTDHRVLNNYFEGLTGDDHRSTIGLMNGVPNNALNGYAPVERAVIAFNTIVDCKVPVFLGLGAGKTQNAAPTDCIVANNVILGRATPRTDKAEPVRLDWRGNLTAENTAELGFARDEAGLWRPTATSPIRGAAVGTVEGVVVDLDGQPRTAPFDAGCDQFDETTTLRPLTAGDVGPDWFDETDRAAITRSVP